MRNALIGYRVQNRGKLFKIQDNYPKYVVTMDEFESNIFEGGNKKKRSKSVKTLQGLTALLVLGIKNTN
ncbi:hypothetical protein [Actinobacillus porcinus]|uniref:hypothetical protein n=1 Tax=Actinobacillus porcinus TaxID=51048 RepID=UPI002A90FEE8|nr:hypothetical protein [Actinobacillus porcinus]MDY6216777.1 hypothetical protein [Actinobacillus porcinus]